MSYITRTTIYMKRTTIFSSQMSPGTQQGRSWLFRKLFLHKIMTAPLIKPGEVRPWGSLPGQVLRLRLEHQPKGFQERRAFLSNRDELLRYEPFFSPIKAFTSGRGVFQRWNLPLGHQSEGRLPGYLVNHGRLLPQGSDNSDGLDRTAELLHVL